MFGDRRHKRWQGPARVIAVVVAVLLSSCTGMAPLPPMPPPPPSLPPPPADPPVSPFPPPPPMPMSEAPVEPTRAREEEGFPQFPWPPPKASAFAKLPRSEIIPSGLSLPQLNDAAHRLEQALDVAGYDQRRYYAIPGGFALVTQIEQMRSDGTPKSAPDRWSVPVPHAKVVDLKSYLLALLTKPVGHYRVIAFVVTDRLIKQGEASLSEEEARGWTRDGGMGLPQEIATIPYSDTHEVGALIYEFEKKQDEAAVLIQQSLLTGKTHLERSGILKALKSL